jgi:hypothetical protein
MGIRVGLAYEILKLKVYTVRPDVSSPPAPWYLSDWRDRDAVTTIDSTIDSTSAPRDDCEMAILAGAANNGGTCFISLR